MLRPGARVSAGFIFKQNRTREGERFVMRVNEHRDQQPALVSGQKVVIAGYFGFGNAGDEAILSVLVERLKQECADVEIVIVSGDPQSTEQLYKARAIAHRDISGLITEIESCDLVVLGGGGLFHDYWGVPLDTPLTRHHSGISFYAIFPLLAALYGKPFILNGVGVGPLFSDAGRYYTRMIFDQATNATLRDDESRELLLSIGVSAERLKVTADPAFCLTAASRERAAAILESEGLGAAKQPLVGVSVREWVFRPKQDHWVKELAVALDQLIERRGAKVLLLPFQRLESDLTDDYKVSMKVRDLMRRGDEAVVIKGDYTAEEKAGLIGLCDLVIGMRLHSIIFAATGRVPVVGLVYDPKVSRILKQLDCQEYGIDLGELRAADVLKKAEQSLQQRHELARKIDSAAQRLILLAQQNIRFVVDALGNSRQYEHSPSHEVMGFIKDSLTRLMRRADEREEELEAVSALLIEREKTLESLSSELTTEHEAHLEETQKIIHARDEGIAWLKQQLSEKDEEVQRLVGEVARHKQFAEALQDQLPESTTRLVELQDQLLESTTRLADVQDQLLESTTRLADVQDQLLESTTRLADVQDQLLESTTRLAESSRRVETLEAEARELDRALSVKKEEVDSLKGNVAKMKSRIAEQAAGLDYRLAQLEEREKTIRARDEAVERLKQVLAESERKDRQLAASNDLLAGQLASRERARQALASQLASTQADLNKITGSIGWKLLSRYGRIKYRYLLPLYRLFGVAQAEPGQPPPQIHGATAQATEEGIAEQAQTGLATEEVATGGVAPEQLERRAVEAAKPISNEGFYDAITILPKPDADEMAAILDHSSPTAPLRRADVICFSIIDWEFRYQRPQQVMSQFAAGGHRVFYISTTRFQPDTASPRIRVERIKENVYEVQLATTRQPDVYGEAMGGELQESLLKSLDELRRTYQIDEAISYCMIASWGSVALETREQWGWKLIYDCMDEWENFPGIKRAILDMEIRLVRESDLLVVTAQRLYEKWESFDRPMVLARNAVDTDFYNQRYRPNDALSGVKRPVVGYFGAIADWFDLELMAYAARSRPQYTFVLIGGVFGVDVSALEALPNVRLQGQQPYEMMPEYLYHFDACIIPFKINPITEATDPVKLYEYLSAGKPVVSVALAELAPYREYLYLAEGREDFVEKLDLAVEEDDREMVERRRELARENTWKNRYEVIAEGINRVTPRASIIIVTYNNLALNKLCVESIIRKTEYQNYEIIIVDNASADGTPSYLKYLAAHNKNISIILNPQNNGFAKANNQGIALSTGDYIVLLNNDTVVPAGWLSRLVRHLQSEEIGMVGPVTNFVGNEAKIEVPYSTCGEMEDFAKQYTWEHDGQVADIHMLAMFCVAFRRSIYQEVGPLDQQFGIGMFEDDDYAQRVKAKGYRIVCVADVFVHHFGQAAFKKLIERGEYNDLFEENRRRYEAKWNLTWIPHKHAPLNFEARRPSRPEMVAGQES
jgi:polysaccharide pyruvyl transferase CsaB